MEETFDLGQTCFITTLVCEVILGYISLPQYEWKVVISADLGTRSIIVHEDVNAFVNKNNLIQILLFDECFLLS